MSFATMPSNGQIIIPLSVRNAAGLHGGDKIHLTILEGGIIIARVKNKSIRDVAVKPKTRRRVAAEQMNR